MTRHFAFLCASGSGFDPPRVSDLRPIVFNSALGLWIVYCFCFSSFFFFFFFVLIQPGSAAVIGAEVSANNGAFVVEKGVFEKEHAVGDFRSMCVYVRF